MWRVLCCAVLSCAVWVSQVGVAQGLGMKARIHGASYVNLRSGPELSHPPKAVLKEGEEVKIEGEEKEWYLVSVADGRRGYIHKSLVQPLKKDTSERVPESEPLFEPVSVSVDSVAPVPSAAPPKEKKSARESVPLIRMIEGREGEVALWFVIGLCIFIIGWICGGNYYLRRDRKSRTKIRL